MARPPKVQLVIDGKDNTKNAFGAIDKSLGALEKRTASVGKAMAGAFAGLVSIATLKRIADINMEFRELDKVLRQNTGSLEEFNFAQDETSRIADELGVSLDQVVNNFGKLNGSLAALGYSSRDSLKMVETISKLMSLEGADPGPTIARFNRAMSKGELHGARFNLMLQDQPALLDLIAEATGKTITELRAMSEAGELTADIMGDSLLQMSAAIDERFSELPKTIEQATTRIRGNIAEAFRDEELMQPVVDSLNSLADTLKDPDVQHGLANLAAGMAGAVKTGAVLAAEFGALGQQAGYWAASLSGQVTELDRLEAEIKDVDRALKGSFLTKPIRYLGTSDEELRKIRTQLEKQKEAVINDMTGTTAEMREAEEKRQRELAVEKEKEMAIHRKYVNDLKQANKDALKAVEDRGKELSEAEKDAAKKVLDAKKEAENLLKQFDDIRKNIAGGGDKEPSFVEYQKLATSARQALAAGDTKTAKEDALAAANLLKELAAAGENTFGFQGLVKSMQDVAKSASDIEQSNAEAELEKIKAEMASLSEQAEALKAMPVSMELDDESLEAARTEIVNLLDKLKIEAVIPVKLAAQGGDADIPGFARGGHIRGPGTGTSDSILARLSNGEYVIRAAAVRKYGTDVMHKLNNMQLPKFATGGAVGAVADMQTRNARALGTLNFNLPGGESFSVQTAGDWSDDLRRAALKYGSPRRR